MEWSPRVPSRKDPRERNPVRIIVRSATDGSQRDPSKFAKQGDQAGDVVFFDHLTVHRAGTTPAFVRERYGIESEFFAPSAYPAEGLALAV